MLTGWHATLERGKPRKKLPKVQESRMISPMKIPDSLSPIRFLLSLNFLLTA